MIFNYNSDISTDMDSDSDEEGPPGLPGFGGGGGLPGMGPPGMWGGGHQQGSRSDAVAPRGHSH